jgi:hypothetical protein
MRTLIYCAMADERAGLAAIHRIKTEAFAELRGGDKKGAAYPRCWLVPRSPQPLRWHSWPCEMAAPVFEGNGFR